MLTVVYELIHPNARVPTRGTEESAGWDVYLPHDTSVKPTPFKISLGFRMQIPRGWEASLRPRSGLSFQGIRLVNSPATIDCDYRGEVCVVFEGPYTLLQGGNRVAQMLFSQVPDVQWVKAGEGGLSQTSRGIGGFGSTGK